MNEANSVLHPLTRPQIRTLLAIQLYMDKHGYAPSVQDVADVSGLASKSTAHCLMTKLAAAGYIVYEGVRRVRVLVRI